jgi:hypothetical protein
MISKVLERIKLTASEEEAWKAIQEQILAQEAEPQTSVHGPIQELQKEVHSLAATVKRLAENTGKQQSWAQIA